MSKQLLTLPKTPVVLYLRFGERPAACLADTSYSPAATLDKQKVCICRYTRGVFFLFYGLSE